MLLGLDSLIVFFPNAPMLFAVLVSNWSKIIGGTVALQTNSLKYESGEGGL